MNSFWKRVAVAAVVLTTVAACVTRVPEQALSWSSQTPAERQLTTRWFETGNEGQVVRAATDVLRSAGYRILKESEEELGLLVAAKETDPTFWEKSRDYGKVMAILLLTFGGASGNPVVQKSQEVRVSVLVRSDLQQTTYLQAIFQRLVWDSHYRGQVTILSEPELYRMFFGKVSNVLSLKAHEL